MATLNDSCFAYPALRKFPINTEEAAKSSYGAYKVQKSAFSAEQCAIIDGNFTKAASYYGIQLEEPEKPAEKREFLKFRGATEHVDMPQIRNVAELNKATDFILEKRASTYRANLTEPAKYVLWAAANAGVALDTDKMRKIAHIAGIGVGERSEIQEALETRAVMLSDHKKDKDAMWKFANDVKKLSDVEFFDVRNINTICDAIDTADMLCGNMHKTASDPAYAEDVVFRDTLSDLNKQAADMYYVSSIDTVLSKKATLERKDAINGFLSAHFDKYEALDGDKLFQKVASLDELTADALLEALK